MPKITTAVDRLIEWAILVLTFRPHVEKSRPSIKVFGKPSFSGGPATKFAQLAPITAGRWDSWNTVLCLSAVRVPLIGLRLLRLIGARVLVNQNGVYYPSWYGEGYRTKNKYLARLNALAHHSFFQSEFSRLSYQDWVAPPPKSLSILFNPVDTKKFYPGPDAKKVCRVLIFTDVAAVSESIWKHAIEVIQTLIHSPIPDHPIEWVLAGAVLESSVFESLGLNKPQPHVETHWNIQSGQVPELLRTCRVALHLKHNDPCPNKVLECLASGLWVIAGDSGGTPELVGQAGQCLPTRHGYEQPDYPSAIDIRNALVSFMQSPEQNAQKARNRAMEFEISNWLRKIEGQSISKLPETPLR